MIPLHLAVQWHTNFQIQNPIKFDSTVNKAVQVRPFSGACPKDFGPDSDSHAVMHVAYMMISGFKIAPANQRKGRDNSANPPQQFAHSGLPFHAIHGNIDTH